MFIVKIKWIIKVEEKGVYIVYKVVLNRKGCVYSV